MKEDQMKNLWLAEMNLSMLFTNTEAFHPRRIEASKDVHVLEVRYDLLPPNSLVVKGTIGGLTDTYQTIIKFLEISLKGRTPINTLKGVKKISKINPKSNDVEVFCGCPFFKWAFNTPDHQIDALFDPAKNLRREQPIGSLRGRSPNPTQIPGLCKHLIALTNYLKNERIITRI